MLVRNSQKYLVSVFFPTRKRVVALDKTINSLISLSNKDLNNYEILIKADFDDVDTIDYIKSLNKPNIKFIIGSRLGGWNNMVDFNEDLIDQLFKG